MTDFDKLLLLATASCALSPIIAVQLQKLIERATEQRRKRRWIFETLMATRATRIAPEHVNALNQIDIAFAGKNWFGLLYQQPRARREVIEAWRHYADTLNEPVDQMPKEAVASWNRRNDDAFVELVRRIGYSIGYGFDAVQIRRGIYYPRGLSEFELRQVYLQEALARVLSGAQALTMDVRSLPGVTTSSETPNAANDQAVHNDNAA